MTATMNQAYTEDNRMYIARAIQEAAAREERIKRIVNWEDRHLDRPQTTPKSNPTHTPTVKSIGAWNFIKSLRP